MKQMACEICGKNSQYFAIECGTDSDRAEIGDLFVPLSPGKRDRARCSVACWMLQFRPIAAVPAHVNNEVNYEW